MNKEIFKAYDIRGKYPDDVNEEAFELIAKAYSVWLKPKKVALGRDVRTSGKSLWDAVARGLTDMGVNVVDVGVISTDMLYFAVGHYGFDGGLSVTGSHNPAEDNGLKLVREDSRPISMESGIAQIRDLAFQDNFVEAKDKGRIVKLDIMDDYINEIIKFIDVDKVKPFKVAVNPNFGAAGVVLDRLADVLGLELVKINFEQDGTFPKGRPDPMIPSNREEIARLVVESGADFGVTWDADADRCFFYDENGKFVDGYYEAALLAQIVLEKYPNGKIVHDPRLIWATVDLVKQAGGIPLINKVGHSFIKARMREEDAVFGGENSGHFYFKDYFFCDNGMIPFLLVLNKLSKTGQKFSELIDYMQEKYPNSGETNFTVVDKATKLKEIEQKYADGKIEHIDGVSIEYADWRFNVRESNTEPLLRLNLEAKNKELVMEKLKELTELIQG
jgi:phosphomannomutase